jgi:hypothetical protein
MNHVPTMEEGETPSKQGMMSRLKQQVEQTGGFLKKQHQAFTDKVSKGLSQKGFKILGGRKSCEMDASDQKSQPTQLRVDDREATLLGKDSGLVATFEEMGFDKASVAEAMEILGGEPRDFDDLLQVLTVVDTSKKNAEDGMDSTTWNASGVSAEDEVYEKSPKALDAPSESTIAEFTMAMQVDPHPVSDSEKSLLSPPPLPPPLSPTSCLPTLPADVESKAIPAAADEAANACTSVATKDLAVAVVASTIAKVLAKSKEPSVAVELPAKEVAGAMLIRSTADLLVSPVRGDEKQVHEGHGTHSSPVVGGA